MAARRSVNLSPQTSPQAFKVFLSYRRDDSAHLATFLQADLERRLGKGSVFRDERSIAPGDAFPKRLEIAIRDAAVVLVLIGPNWLNARDAKTGGRRLDLPGDFVRKEVELALKYQRRIVPVLFDGVAMPRVAQLPHALAPLVERQACVMPSEPLEAVEAAVRDELDRLKTELAVPVGPRPTTQRASSRDAALHAMRSALQNQGAGLVDFDAGDLDATLARLSSASVSRTGGFQLRDLIYAIDLVGVKLKRGRRRYVARSRQVVSIDALIEALDRRHTVLAAVGMPRRWLEHPARTRGTLDVPPEPPELQLLGVVSAYHRTPPSFLIHLSFRDFGDDGVVRITRAAAQKLFDRKGMYVIDPGPMPLPVSEPALEDYQSRLPRTKRE